MKLYRNIICVVLSALAAFAVGCSDEGVDNREHNYGYAQFKLYNQGNPYRYSMMEQNTRKLGKTSVETEKRA